MTIKIQPGGHIMNIKCNDNELKEVVLSCMDSFEDIFSFKQLCDTICHKLDENGWLEKEEHVEYQGGFKLSPTVTDKIQQFTWEQIWNKKLMIDLLNDEYRYTPDRSSIRLLKVK